VITKRKRRRGGVIGYGFPTDEGTFGAMCASEKYGSEEAKNLGTTKIHVNRAHREKTTTANHTRHTAI